MPHPDAPGPRVTRRAVLVSTAALGLSGCTPRRGLDRRPKPAPTPVEPEVDPDVAVAAAALRAETAVGDLVRATLQRHPALAARLTPVARAHGEHTSLLADAVPDGAPEPSPGPASPAIPGVDPTTVPRDRRRALRRLARAEQDLAVYAKQQAFKARSGAFARVLGSMAASAAQQAALLAPASEGAGS